MEENIEQIQVDLTPEPPKVEEAPKDIEIVVADQLEDEDRNEKDPQKAIEKLKKKLKREKEARREAEEKARKAALQVQKANYEVADTQLHLVNNAIETVARDNEILAANYAEAMRSGEYEQAARINAAISKNEKYLEDLQNGHVRMKEEVANKQPLQNEPLKPKQQIDQIISQVSKPSAQWLKENRDFFTSEKMINKMFRAHGDAIDDGIDPDTPKYFRYIESRLGINQNEDGGSPMSSASKPTQKKAPPPPAPVNRDGGNRNVGWLTPAQAEMAKSLGMTDREYYESLSTLKKEGRITH